MCAAESASRSALYTARPFLTINGQWIRPHECDLHINQTQMEVLCLVGKNGRRTEKSKKAKLVEVETLVGEVEARKVDLFGHHGIGITNKKRSE